MGQTKPVRCRALFCHQFLFEPHYFGCSQQHALHNAARLNWARMVRSAHEQTPSSVLISPLPGGNFILRDMPLTPAIVLMNVESVTSEMFKANGIGAKQLPHVSKRQIWLLK